MKTFTGQKASSGFAIGPAYILRSSVAQIPQNVSMGAQAEQILFQQALEKAKKDLTALSSAASAQNKSQSVEILAAHITLLEDPEATEMTLSQIRNGSSAQFSYYSVIEEFRHMFLQVEDELIRQRAVDLKDIRDRVLFYIQNPTETFPDFKLQTPTIIVAEDLTPSQIFSVDKSNLLGFVTVEGGATSHTAILARSLEIPAIMGVDKNVLAISANEILYLNGEAGQISKNLNADEINLFLKNIQEYEKQLQTFYRLRGQKSQTMDGHVVTLAANISGPQDINSFQKNDAEAVGLYRTEFLFLDRSAAPSESEQYQIYKDVFTGVKGKHILVRTLDIGGDKKADYLKMKSEENPFLGIRALRLCFQRPEIFKTQLRALLRAAGDTNADWGLMFPMVSQLEELMQAKSFVDEVQKELELEQKHFSKKFKIGIMIEIPSAAWMIDILAKHVDFISIGTNDLLQYTCAADRLNPDLKSVYNPYNIGFLRQMHHILKTCADQKIHSGICGSLSHHADLMSFFIGCGVNELSMTSQHVLATRSSLRGLNYRNCINLVQKILACSTTSEAKKIFSEFHSQCAK